MYIRIVPKSIVCIVFILIPSPTLQQLNFPEDATLNFTALGRKYGHPVEEHDVTTQDGYILKLFHIKGDTNRPVLLMHGVLDCADTFIIRGNSSLAVTLARAGYDVWAANARTAAYSRRHTKLNPDSKAFWDFSYHDVGYYDLPATIDYILNTSGAKKLSAIAHSQGNTVFYVLGATRPEYNEKINIMAALGPVCFLENLPLPLRLLPDNGPLLNSVLVAFNTEEMFDEELRRFLRSWCMKSEARRRVCVNMFHALVGRDEKELGPDFFSVVIAHYPSSTSRKNGMHLLQNARSKRFALYDYGDRNMQVYKSRSPPDYALNKVTMKIALYTGRNDKITPLKNVERLVKKLPNVVEHNIMSRSKFNHMDHVWGKNMNVYLFPYLLRLLEKYT